LADLDYATRMRQIAWSTASAARAAQAQQPRDVGAALLLGNSHWQLGFFPAARTAWRQAVALAPLDWRAPYALAQSYCATPRGAQSALQWLQYAHEANRSDANILAGFVRMLVASGQAPRAHACLAAADDVDFGCRGAFALELATCARLLARTQAPTALPVPAQPLRRVAARCALSRDLVAALRVLPLPASAVYVALRLRLAAKRTGLLLELERTTAIACLTATTANIFGSPLSIVDFAAAARAERAAARSAHVRIMRQLAITPYDPRFITWSELPQPSRA
jgi:tetratricopeptide (TPR) repeat protein